jgi:hypothetical protein
VQAGAGARSSSKTRPPPVSTPHPCFTFDNALNLCLCVAIGGGEQQPFVSWQAVVDQLGGDQRDYGTYNFNQPANFLIIAELFVSDGFERYGSSDSGSYCQWILDSHDRHTITTLQCEYLLKHMIHDAWDDRSLI